MKEYFIGIGLGTLFGIAASHIVTNQTIIENCIKANADMPYNKVEGYCKDKLKSLQVKE